MRAKSKLVNQRCTHRCALSLAPWLEEEEEQAKDLFPL